MDTLGLPSPSLTKRKRPLPATLAERDGLEGRRLQIDATRFRLDDGVAWADLVAAVQPPL